MHIAATDYDGTLCVNGKVDDAVLSAVRQWRAKGNRFGIVTGRDRDMILHPIAVWDIPYDFLLCCNGAAIYDRELTLLAARFLDDGSVARILGHPAAAASLHWELCPPEATLLHMLHKDSWFPKLGTPFREVGRKEALALTGILQIGLAYHTAEESERHAATLNAAFGDHVRAHHNGTCIDITAKDVDKARGLHNLLGYYGWAEKDLLVIGDGGNDLPMLRRYRGFTLPHADSAVLAAASAVYADVGAMLLCHMGDGKESVAEKY